MYNLPIEIQDSIFDFIYYKKCYLDEYLECQEIPYFKRKSGCSPLIFNIFENRNLEICLKHDIHLIINLKKILDIVKLNYNQPLEFYVYLLIDNVETKVPLTELYLEPYIGLLDMNYIYHSVSFEEMDNKEIRRLNQVIKLLFSYIGIEYRQESYGFNAFKLNPYIDAIINKF